MANPAQTLRDFGFSDGQYLAHVAEGGRCIMDYRNWREELYRFVFEGVALIRVYGGTASLCEASFATESPLIDDARRVLAQDWGTSGGPKDVPLVELCIADDVPVFAIVFADVRIVGPMDARDVMTLESVVPPGEP